MANIRSEKATAELYRKILTASTALFIQKGFERTTFTEIAKLSGVPKSKILYEFSSKEDILGFLVRGFLDGVAKASDAASKELTDNKLHIFIANEVLQLYMAEMNEYMRNLYLAGYSMPKTSEEVLKRRTDIMYDILGSSFPDYEKKDFYETEIASMGIMRAYMTVPCDMYFTIETKAKKLVEMLLHIYRTDEEKISEALELIQKINFEAIAVKAIEDVFRKLEIKDNN